MQVPVTAKDFDICADITYPQAHNPDGATIAGFILRLKDWKNYTRVWTAPVGSGGAQTISNGAFRQLAWPRKYTALKGGAGSTNEFELVVKGNLGTVYGNGKRLFVFRVPSDEPPQIYLFALSETTQSNPWRFTKVTVMNVEQTGGPSPAPSPSPSPSPSPKPTPAPGPTPPAPTPSPAPLPWPPH